MTHISNVDIEIEPDAELRRREHGAKEPSRSRSMPIIALGLMLLPLNAGILLYTAKNAADVRESRETLSALKRSIDGLKQQISRQAVNIASGAKADDMAAVRKSVEELQKDVADLFRSLDRHGFSVGALHGDMDQRSRMTMLANFKDGNIKLLVASDVAARGLDIPDVSHVFNFDVPIHAEDYVHRIGRTGRAGRSGASFTLVTKRDTKFSDAIEKLIGQKVEWLNGDLSNLPEPMESHDTGRRDRGRDGRRDRKKDGDRGSKGRPDHKSDTVRADSEAEIETVAERAESVKPARSTENKQGQNNRADRPVRASNPANDDNRDRRNRHRRDYDDGPTPVGFGDEIPAFMLIAGKA